MTSPDTPPDAGCPELQPALVEALSPADFSADIATTSTLRVLADRTAALAAPAQPDEWEALRIELATLFAEELPRQVIRGGGGLHDDHPHAYSAFIDWLSFTFRLRLTAGDGLRAFDDELRQCFGFGLSACRNRGHLNYKESWVFGDNYDFFATGEAYQAFESEAHALLKQAKPDPAAARRRLNEARKELDNLMAAIRAGIVTPTTKAALQHAERQAADAQEEPLAIERFEPTQILPRAREIYRDMVARLEAVEDVTAAREALRSLIGDVRLVPENGTLTAEMQNAGLAGVLQITLVAGAGFEPATFGL